MTYSTDDAIKKIVDFKKQWEDANNSGDLVAKGNAEKYAKKVYDLMRANGDSAIADELSASNYTKSQQVRDTYYKMGKTETRPYLYSLGKKYGMSQSEVDSIIGWDENTGEISLGGKKIGRPDALVGGSSYWNDPSVLDSAFSDYVSRTGKTKPTSTMVSNGNEDVMEKYKKTFETAMNENPYETEVGKSIMGKYNLAAIQGRENQLASGAATNGGNIDSFSAANAMRQQAGLIYQGQEAALTAHQQKIDNAQKILEGMGVHIDRMYNQDETTKNNEVSRQVAKSEVTGYVPTEWTYDNNIYLNTDGTVRDEYLTDEFDATGGFSTIINDAKAKLATTTDATERANLQATINAATQAKALKTFSSPKYAKYAHEVTATTPQETATVKQANADRESAEKIASGTNTTTENVANIEAKNNLDVLEKQIETGVLRYDPEDYPNQINTNNVDYNGLIKKDENGRYTTYEGVDYYGVQFLNKMKEWLTTSDKYKGVINLDDENERQAFINQIPAWTKATAVDLTQLRKVMDYLGISATINVDELFEDSTEMYKRERDGAQWAKGVVRKEKEDSQVL